MFPVFCSNHAESDSRCFGVLFVFVVCLFVLFLLFVCFLLVFSVLVLFNLNWRQCGLHKRLLRSCLFVKLPPQNTEPVTELTVYLSLQQSELFISVFTVPIVGNTLGNSRGVSSTRDIRSFKRTGRRGQTLQIIHLQSGESHRHSFCSSLFLSHSGL